MATYEVEMRDECGSDHEVTVEAETTTEAIRLAKSECEEWAQDGDWGQDGASVPVWYTVTDEDGDEIADSVVHVEIEPDHDVLIRAAGGDSDCDHDWTSEGEGGCSQNPGVWSTGGTSMLFATHCRLCGLHRTEKTCGSQRNPGKHDTTTYEQPDSWCSECEREECICRHECSECGGKFPVAQDSDEPDGDEVTLRDGDWTCGDCLADLAETE